MPIFKTEKYSLLRNSESRQSDVDSTEELQHDTDVYDKPIQNQRQDLRTNTLLITGFASSALVNVVLVLIVVIMVVRQTEHTVTEGATKVSSAYAGLQEDPAIHFPYSVGYGPEITNHSLADERWEAIDINPGVVALPFDWAEEHNLPPSQPFPWDPSKGLYTLTAFHTLHCLKNIHRLLYDAHHSRPLSRDIGHAMHCLDHIRKDTMCNADDFLLPTPPEHYDMAGPRGQSRVCKNWDQLVHWANDHHACYQHMDDDEAGFAKTHKEIERYQNCPPGSPYESAMKAYFEEERM